MVLEITKIESIIFLPYHNCPSLCVPPDLSDDLVALFSIFPGWTQRKGKTYYLSSWTIDLRFKISESDSILVF